MTRRRLFGGVAARGCRRCDVVGAALPLRTRAAAASSGDPLVPTTRVTRGSLELSVHANGELRASKSAMLIAPSVGGTLRIVRLLDAGMSVKAGEVIAEFDPTEQQYALEQARSELEEAEQQIVKKKADLEVQSAEDRVELLTARFDVRRAELDNLADIELISAQRVRQEPAGARTGQPPARTGATPTSRPGSTPIARLSRWSKRSAPSRSSRPRARSRTSTASCSGRRSTVWSSSATIATPRVASSFGDDAAGVPCRRQYVRGAAESPTCSISRGWSCACRSASRIART